MGRTSATEGNEVDGKGRELLISGLWKKNRENPKIISKKGLCISTRKARRNVYPKFVPLAKYVSSSYSLEQLRCQSNCHLKQNSNWMKFTSTRHSLSSITDVFYVLAYTPEIQTRLEVRTGDFFELSNYPFTWSYSKYKVFHSSCRDGASAPQRLWWRADKKLSVSQNC